MNNEINLASKELRTDRRAAYAVRPISFTLDILGFADASVLFCQGNTKVLVSVSLQQGVPVFLKGQGSGWLTAEYAMLPTSTHQRSPRESTQAQRNARGVEISRFIGRCLRNCINLDLLKEKTIIVDCDVLQADGGTRVSCITAASIALNIAITRWVKKRLVPSELFIQQIAAISIGIKNKNILVDPNYEEDCTADADFNFVLTNSNALIEIQGTAEKQAIPWNIFEEAKVAAQEAISTKFKTINTVNAELSALSKESEFQRDQISQFLQKNVDRKNKQDHNSFFNLGARLQKK